MPKYLHCLTPFSNSLYISFTSRLSKRDFKILNAINDKMVENVYTYDYAIYSIYLFTSIRLILRVSQYKILSANLSFYMKVQVTSKHFSTLAFCMQHWSRLISEIHSYGTPESVSRSSRALTEPRCEATLLHNGIDIFTNGSPFLANECSYLGF